MASNPSNTPKSANRPKIETFRQTRVPNEVNHLTMTINGQNAEVKNWSRTGIAIETREKFQVGLKVGQVRILCQEILVFEGEIRIRWTRAENGGAWSYGASF